MFDVCLIDFEMDFSYSLIIHQVETKYLVHGTKFLRVLILQISPFNQNVFFVQKQNNEIMLLLIHLPEQSATQEQDVIVME